MVKTIRDTHFDSLLAGTQDTLAEAGLVAEYRSCVVDFFCGKLRRLESEICSMGERRVPSECGAADTVLLVEDDIVCAELARGLLERNGFDVIVAKTAEAAFHELVWQRPSLVLLDVHLGGSNGLHVVKLMRSRADLQGIPVIIITSDRQRDTLFDAIDMQVQGYLLKPYQPKQFIDKVKNVMQNPPISVRSNNGASD